MWWMQSRAFFFFLFIHLCRNITWNHRQWWVLHHRPAPCLPPQQQRWAAAWRDIYSVSKLENPTVPFHPALVLTWRQGKKPDLSSLVRVFCINMHIFIPSCGLDIALTAFRSDPEQKDPPAPQTMRPFPSVQLSSWLTFSSSSTIMLPAMTESEASPVGVLPPTDT